MHYSPGPYTSQYAYAMEQGGVIGPPRHYIASWDHWVDVTAFGSYSGDEFITGVRDPDLDVPVGLYTRYDIRRAEEDAAKYTGEPQATFQYLDDVEYIYDLADLITARKNRGLLGIFRVSPSTKHIYLLLVLMFLTSIYAVYLMFVWGPWVPLLVTPVGVIIILEYKFGTRPAGPGPIRDQSWVHIPDYRKDLRREIKGVHYEQ